MPFLLPGDLPHPGTELLSLTSPASAGGFFATSIPWEAGATWEAYSMHKPPQFLVAQMVKNPPAMWETWVPSLDWEDPLVMKMATLSSILASRIPWTGEPGRLLSMGSQGVRYDRVTFTFTFPTSTPEHPLITKKVGPPDYNIFCFYQGNMIHKIFLH